MSATSTLVKALAKASGVRVATNIPEKKPEQFILVSRIGGGADDWATRNPHFLVECYSTKSKIDSEDLAERVWELWPSLRDNATIMWARQDNNLAFFDDPDPALHRHQFTAWLQCKPTLVN